MSRYPDGLAPEPRRIRDDVLECQGNSYPEAGAFVIPEDQEMEEAWNWYTLELYEAERE